MRRWLQRLQAVFVDVGDHLVRVGPRILPDLVGLAGAAVLVRGLALIHPALAWIVAGGMMMAIALLAAADERRRRSGA